MNDFTGSNAPPAPAPLSPAQVTDWLNWQHEPLLERQRELLTALQRMLDAYPTVADAEADQTITDNVSLTGAFLKAVKAAFKTAKDPFVQGGRAVDAWQAHLVDPIDQLRAELTRRQTVFQVAREARARAEAAQRAEDLRRAAEEQTRAALAAKDSITREATYDLAEHLAAEQSKAERAASGRGESIKTRGQYGMSSLRRTWTYRIIDLAKVPRPFLAIDDARVKDAMRERDPATNRPARTIPGIEWVEEVRTTHR